MTSVTMSMPKLLDQPRFIQKKFKYALTGDAKKCGTWNSKMVKSKHDLAATDHVQRRRARKSLDAEEPKQWRRASGA